MSCCLRITPPLAPPPRVVVEVLEEAWAISSNLGNWGMAAEDGPWLVARSTCQCSSRVTICTMNGALFVPTADVSHRRRALPDVPSSFPASLRRDGIVLGCG